MSNSSEYPAISNWLAAHKQEFQINAFYRPESLRGPQSTGGSHHDCIYDVDEDGNTFVTIVFNLPDGCYAEIEDGTYGTLQGFRIYLKADAHEG